MLKINWEQASDKSCVMLIKHLVEDRYKLLTVNKVNWQQVNNMNGYKKRESQNVAANLVDK